MVCVCVRESVCARESVCVKVCVCVSVRVSSCGRERMSELDVVHVKRWSSGSYDM